MCMYYLYNVFLSFPLIQAETVISVSVCWFLISLMLIFSILYIENLNAGLDAWYFAVDDLNYSVIDNDISELS
jgi:hypothetical protein